MAVAKLVMVIPTWASTWWRSEEISGLWAEGSSKGGRTIEWTRGSRLSGASADSTAAAKLGLPTDRLGLPSTRSNPLAMELGSCWLSKVSPSLASKWKLLLLISEPPPASSTKVAAKTSSEASSTQRRRR